MSLRTFQQDMDYHEDIECREGNNDRMRNLQQHIDL